MTDYLDEIQARADALAAAPGPWHWGVSDCRRWVEITAPGYDRAVATTHDDDLADFIAYARTDIPRLIAALRAVEAVFADWEGFDVVDEARAAIRDALEAR